MRDILAVVDTNVFVAAFLTRNPDSATAQIVYRMFDGAFLPVVNDEILKEYSEVLMRAKFNLDKKEITKFIDAVSSIALHLDQTDYPEELPDPKDRVFYVLNYSHTG